MGKMTNDEMNFLLLTVAVVAAFMLWLAYA